MKRQLLAFIILNILIATLTVLAFLPVWNAVQSKQAPPPTATPITLHITTTPAPNVTIIAAGPPPSSTPPPPSPTPQTHIIQPGDHCMSIAEAYGVPLDALLRVNKLGADCLIYPGDALSIPAGEALIDDRGETAPPRDGVTTYTVRAGDTVSGIAFYFDLQIESIFWANQEVLGDAYLLQIGQELNIIPVDGALHISSGQDSIESIAAFYAVEAETILASQYNDLSGTGAGARPPAGAQIVIPGGAGPDPEDPFGKAMAADAGENRVEGESAAAGGFAPGHSGSCGAVPIDYVGSGSFRWPLPQLDVWTEFSKWHRGIDLGGVPGVPVRAADGGTVIFAGWNDWGYGNTIVLDHGKGFWTLYGHLDTLNLSCRQGVAAGQVIGALGTSGKTTGPHLHFEIRKNGVSVDPRDYVE